MSRYSEEVCKEERAHYYKMSVLRDVDHADEFVEESISSDYVLLFRMPCDGRPIAGVPKRWMPPGLPQDWQYETKVSAPLITVINNPGEWNIENY